MPWWSRRWQSNSKYEVRMTKYKVLGPAGRCSSFEVCTSHFRLYFVLCPSYFSPIRCLVVVLLQCQRLNRAMPCSNCNWLPQSLIVILLNYSPNPHYFTPLRIRIILNFLTM
jgi:hypothetical protein